MTKPRIHRSAFPRDHFWAWRCKDGPWVGMGRTPKDAYDSWVFWRELAKAYRLPGGVHG